MKGHIKRTAMATAILASIAAANPALAQDTIKVGILHSLSGTMAISETTLKDTMLMLIEEQNAKGGLLGKQLEAVVVDPASDWPLRRFTLPPTKTRRGAERRPFVSQ
jgi:urea transport system substrate-binding protein